MVTREKVGMRIGSFQHPRPHLICRCGTPRRRFRLGIGRAGAWTWRATGCSALLLALRKKGVAASGISYRRDKRP